MDIRKAAPGGKKAEVQPPREPGQSASSVPRTAAWGPPGAQSSAQQGLQMQDWVCEPPPRGRPSRHWSVSIDERRRLAVLGARERPDVARDASRCTDIAQMVAELVSEDVDRDVLLPQPPRSAASTNAFQAFLTRSAPFWQHATVQARTSRPPPP
ncbi:testis-expressed protein 22 [Oryctolagus cuniculus]|uniref:testis-expressed protein 22 n=1 Tax=Oryctolagus cuniculus TaxID=9986 RepID=UPI0038794CAF